MRRGSHLSRLQLEADGVSAAPRTPPRSAPRLSQPSPSPMRPGLSWLQRSSVAIDMLMSPAGTHALPLSGAVEQGQTILVPDVLPATGAPTGRQRSSSVAGSLGSPTSSGSASSKEPASAKGRAGTRETPLAYGSVDEQARRRHSSAAHMTSAGAEAGEDMSASAGGSLLLLTPSSGAATPTHPRQFGFPPVVLHTLPRHSPLSPIRFSTERASASRPFTPGRGTPTEQHSPTASSTAPSRSTTPLRTPLRSPLRMASSPISDGALLPPTLCLDAYAKSRRSSSLGERVVAFHVDGRHDGGLDVDSSSPAHPNFVASAQPTHIAHIEQPRWIAPRGMPVTPPVDRNGLQPPLTELMNPATDTPPTSGEAAAHHGTDGQAQPAHTVHSIPDVTAMQSGGEHVLSAVSALTTSFESARGVALAPVHGTRALQSDAPLLSSVAAQAHASNPDARMQRPARNHVPIARSPCSASANAMVAGCAATHPRVHPDQQTCTNPVGSTYSATPEEDGAMPSVRGHSVATKSVETDVTGQRTSAFASPSAVPQLSPAADVQLSIKAPAVKDHATISRFASTSVSKSPTDMLPRPSAAALPAHASVQPGGISMRRLSSLQEATARSCVSRNPYRQRRGIQIIANNALASAVNIASQLHAANQPGGPLHFYMRQFPALAAAGVHTCRMGFGLHIGYAIG
ncbi:MAG: hypothetical protein EOO65_03035, partial [Methanosarcinales archaeon]